jgi:hypothetical protein
MPRKTKVQTSIDKSQWKKKNNMFIEKTSGMMVLWLFHGCVRPKKPSIKRSVSLLRRWRKRWWPK